MQAVLYTLAEKFLQKEDLEKLKEEIHMTRLGQMIFDDGLELGRSQGLEEGRSQGLESGQAQGLELARQIFRLARENVPVQEISRRLAISEEKVKHVLE